nr:immunoglobulin heavy chain junction region [Mus musculus]MBK4195055.1 immunoglobulin heavy chain junction region [Mus musculus]
CARLIRYYFDYW